MTKSITVLILMAILCVMAPLEGSAQSKPRWVSKGVKNLNEQRSNDTYKFVCINTHDPDLEYLKETRTDGIKKYIGETYDVSPDSVTVTTYSDSPLIYRLTYKGKDGTDYQVIARLVHEFDEFDDFELNAFQFEFYQLYAMSEPNVTPLYDEFSITKSYTNADKALGFIPGAAQLRKSQYTKGYVIIGGEIGLAAATLIFDWKKRDANKMKYKEPLFANSWRSKEHGWLNFEIGAVSAFGALYLYNLIDAFVSKGAPQVVVNKRATYPSYTLVPYVSAQDVGVSFVLNF